MPAIYDPGNPNTGSLGDAELKPDSTGGSTIVVWPRTLSEAEQKRVFALADRNGWAILRGGDAGQVTTANLFVRMKGSDPSYPGGYSPTPQRKGVPCYFDDHPKASWPAVSGGKYVASHRNIGPGAPQGVNCDVEEFLGGGCLARLKAYIAETRGSYRTQG